MGGKPRFDPASHEAFKDITPHGTTPNDLIHLAIERACTNFEPGGTMFNAAGFSHEFCKIAQVRGPIDGIVVRCMLYGRTDVVFQQNSDAHYVMAKWRLC